MYVIEKWKSAGKKWMFLQGLPLPANSQRHMVKSLVLILGCKKTANSFYKTAVLCMSHNRKEVGDEGKLTKCLMQSSTNPGT